MRKKSKVGGLIAIEIESFRCSFRWNCDSKLKGHSVKPAINQSETERRKLGTKNNCQDYIPRRSWVIKVKGFEIYISRFSSFYLDKIWFACFLVLFVAEVGRRSNRSMLWVVQKKNWRIVNRPSPIKSHRKKITCL